jgi:CRISPR-associated protein Csx3
MKTNYKGFVVAIGGPPHSGKSVFIAELYRQLLARRPACFVFLQRACPDGEGMWSNESDPRIVAEIRRKGAFSEEFMIFTLKSIENLAKVFPLVLLDLGGKRTAENAEILLRSTHLIIISSKPEENDEWVKFAEGEGCDILGIFDSKLVRRNDGTLDDTVRSWIDFDVYPLRGELFNLDREGSPAPYRFIISRLADWLIDWVDRWVQRSLT